MKAILPRGVVRQKERELLAPMRWGNRRPRTCDPAPLPTPRFFLTDTPCIRVHSRATRGKPLTLAPGIPFRRMKLVVLPAPSRNCLPVDDDDGTRSPLLFGTLPRAGLLFLRLLAPAAAIRRTIIRHLVLL